MLKFKLSFCCYAMVGKLSYFLLCHVVIDFPLYTHIHMNIPTQYHISFTQSIILKHLVKHAANLRCRLISQCLERPGELISSMNFNYDHTFFS